MAPLFFANGPGFVSLILRAKIISDLVRMDLNLGTDRPFILLGWAYLLTLGSTISPRCSVMNPKPTKGLEQLAKQLDQELSGWLAALNLAPTTPADQYVPDVNAAYEQLKAGMGRSSDVLLRKVQVPACREDVVLIACLDGMADTQMVDQDIIQRLMSTKSAPDTWDQTAMTPVHISQEKSWSKILQDLAAGNTLIFAPGLAFVWIVDTVKYKQRAIERPQTELSVRGTEEAFNEILLTQKNQIRRHLLTPTLQFHDIVVGRVQHTTVSVAYLEDVTNSALVDVAIKRLEAIKIDGVANSTAIAGLIRDHPRSVFPTMRSTERVDIVIWRLLEGAVVILTEGDPFALIAPSPLVDFYRTAMDYSSSWADSSFVRMIRFAGWILGMYLPALYLALADVNPNVLPTELFVVMQGSHAGLPFPPTVEMVLMILVIEILRESALRLPKVLSVTLGTVGAIVVGTAVVKAGLVDPQIIVIMTLTALSLFSTPVYELTGTWRVFGFFLLLGGALLGILGVVLVTMGALAVMMDMETFGVPYFAPWAPLRLPDWKDTIVRVPWTNFVTRWHSTRAQRAGWRTPVEVSGRPHLLKRRRSS